MRKWYKYKIQENIHSDQSTLDNSEEEHTNALTIKDVNNAYESKSNFYKYYYYNFHNRRLEYYDNFLDENLNKNDQILSVATGRSANELRFIDRGYNIHCTDLYKFKWYNNTKKLWPNYKFSILDIARKSSNKKYNKIIALSLIFIFDDDYLNKFFININKSLRNNGYLILDSAGSPDNFGSFFIHDVFLKLEIYIIKIIKSLSNFGSTKYSIIKHHHGYRRTDKEIIALARNNGFKLITVKNYSFFTEFERSYILSFMIKKIPLMKHFFKILGKKIPYIRMFLFQKIK
tara:strand:+ start:560 stop:1426 length:867 start_codon:yes stop_codon:yes gene_type:complete